MNNNELIDIAKRAMTFAYAPYSNFKVGAAILTDDGRVFTGCNVENSSYGGTICAERCAAVKAISEGAKGFNKIAIVSLSDDYTYPCGMCRQFLNEFSNDMTVIMCNASGMIKEEYLSALLPEAFNLKGYHGQE